MESKHGCVLVAVLSSSRLSFIAHAPWHRPPVTPGSPRSSLRPEEGAEGHEGRPRAPHTQLAGPAGSLAVSHKAGPRFGALSFVLEGSFRKRSASRSRGCV